MSSNQNYIIKYVYEPHNVWMAVIKHLRDTINRYHCQSLLFRSPIVDLPLLTKCKNGPSRCPIFVDRLHSDLRIVFNTGNEKIVHDSFYFLLTTLTHTNFDDGQLFLNLNDQLNPQLQFQSFSSDENNTASSCNRERIKIKYSGDLNLWLDLVALIDRMIHFYMKIESTYAVFLPSKSTVKRCNTAILNTLISCKNQIGQLLKRNKMSDLNTTQVQVSEYRHNGRFEFDHLIFIPKKRLCFLYDSFYLQCEPTIKQTHIYEILIEPVRIINI